MRPLHVEDELEVGERHFAALLVHVLVLRVALVALELLEPLVLVLWRHHVLDEAPVDHGQARLGETRHAAQHDRARHHATAAGQPNAHATTHLRCCLLLLLLGASSCFGDRSS